MNATSVGLRVGAAVAPAVPIGAGRVFASETGSVAAFAPATRAEPAVVLVHGVFAPDPHAGALGLGDRGRVVGDSEVDSRRPP